jgi:chaperone required for assembly of F1-ATPase
MTPKLTKRVWKETTVQAVPGGFSVHLDQRPLRTPGKEIIAVRSRALADGIAAEWDAVVGKIDPAKMPLTRAANTAIDKLVHQRAAVIANLADYGGTDLLCYRAEAPAELVAEQSENWDPVLDWAARILAAPLNVYAGIMPRPQPESSLRKLADQLEPMDEFTLAAVHDLIAISGSLVLGLAVFQQEIAPEAAFELSRLDANFQARLWGSDELAEAATAAHRRDFLAAADLLNLLRQENGRTDD